MGRRRIYLIRHGQHIKEETGNPGSLGPSLTRVGFRQARHTAKALSDIRVNAIYCSSLTRARQTAEIIASTFQGIKPRSNRLLWECIPTRVKNLQRPMKAIEQDRLRAEKVFAKYFRPSRRDRHEIIVTHGNLIRYLVCRTIGLRPTAWINLGTFNCSITRIAIEPDNRKILITFNENRHIPLTLRTSI